MSNPQLPLTAPVLVGVDGSATSLTAVELAAREAALRHRPLRVVHAFIWPLLDVPLDPLPLGPPEGGLRKDAERILDEAVTHARTVDPDLVITGDIVIGAPAAVLLGYARTAALTVIGDRGLGGFTGLLVGSVAVQLAAHAPTPVLVARGRPHPDGAIVLGVDGSPAGQAAVRYAFEAAALRDAELIALHAWRYPASTGHDDLLSLVYDVDAVQADEERLLAEALAGWCQRYPDVVVRRVTLHTGSRKALLEAGREAQLIIVGARGRAGVAGLLLGSVSQAVLHHADCPVVIVPHDRHPSGEH